jgi:hypothetical protein
VIPLKVITEKKLHSQVTPVVDQLLELLVNKTILTAVGERHVNQMTTQTMDMETTVKVLCRRNS